ncbi:hypothetical protein F5Y02DRAFT_354097 [Annulohypoxylon stygium]|nr:hypothetical protein F5Y02DRAFT_354097 [Annulohypoxylon stygium]
MSSQLDLTLPATAPELGKYGHINWDEASFAVYSLIEMSKAQLEEVVDALTHESMEEGLEPWLARLAEPTPDFGGKTLKDIVRAHITMVEKGVNPAGKNRSTHTTLTWYPPAFIVVVKRDWKSAGGLLFVFADDTEKKRCPMDKFFFTTDDAWNLLAGLSFGDLWICDVEESFGK